VIHCLSNAFYQIYIALSSDLPVAIQFGCDDEQDFHVALNSSGGLKRIDDALLKIDATQAHASVATDRDFILAILQRDMGITTFNEKIRNGIKREYSEMSKLAAFNATPRRSQFRRRENGP
jgi:hypothetical protein